MKATDRFKTVIENYLNQTAHSDSTFDESFAKPSKNLESCFNYIFGEVRKTGCCAFDDQEIFDMAVRYYIDDSIGQPAPVQCRVVVKQPAENDLFSSPPAVAQDAPADRNTDIGQDSEVLEIAGDAADIADAQDAVSYQDADISQDSAIVQAATAADGSADRQSSEQPLNAPAPKTASKAKKTVPNTLTLFDL